MPVFTLRFQGTKTKKTFEVVNACRQTIQHLECRYLAVYMTLDFRHLKYNMFQISNMQVDAIMYRRNEVK